jgi:uncharacterized protein YndB with AHSA1/START domain
MAAENTYTVERSMIIDATPERVYVHIADFHQWIRWSPWEDIDPDLQRTYEGAESGTGAVYRWSGNRKAGEGRMEIIDATEPSKVQIDLVFEKPWKARNDTMFTISPQGSDRSRVTWSITGKKTLMTKVMGIFRSMEKFLGPDFEKGLSRLKAATEAQGA